MKTSRLPVKIVSFFTYNQDEELQIADVMVKWSVGYTTAQKALHRLVENGWLMRLAKGKESVFRLNTEASSKKTAHGSGCWANGPLHYLCACQEIKRLSNG